MSDELKNKIADLDLQSVRAKFLSRKSWFWRWKNDVDLIETDYRRFLYLLGTTDHVLVPWTQNLDDFWHEHILDTRKYAEDCQNLFGKLIHHNPGLPKGTPDHKKASKATVEAYKTAFRSTKHEVPAKKKDEPAPTSESSCSSGIETIGLIAAASCSSAPSAPSCSSAASCSGGAASCGSSCGGGGGCGGGGCGGGCGGGD